MKKLTVEALVKLSRAIILSDLKWKRAYERRLGLTPLSYLGMSRFMIRTLPPKSRKRLKAEMYFLISERFALDNYRAMGLPALRIVRKENLTTKVRRKNGKTSILAELAFKEMMR